MNNRRLFFQDSNRLTSVSEKFIMNSVQVGGGL